MAGVVLEKDIRNANLGLQNAHYPLKYFFKKLEKRKKTYGDKPTPEQARLADRYFKSSPLGRRWMDFDGWIFAEKYRPTWWPFQKRNFLGWARAVQIEKLQASLVKYHGTFYPAQTEFRRRFPTMSDVDELSLDSFNESYADSLRECRIFELTPGNKKALEHVQKRLLTHSRTQQLEAYKKDIIDHTQKLSELDPDFAKSEKTEITKVLKDCTDSFTAACRSFSRHFSWFFVPIIEPLYRHDEHPRNDYQETQSFVDPKPLSKAYEYFKLTPLLQNATRANVTKTKTDLKAVYMPLALKLHPDKNPEKNEEFLALQGHYKTINTELDRLIEVLDKHDAEALKRQQEQAAKQAAESQAQTQEKAVPEEKQSYANNPFSIFASNQNGATVKNVEKTLDNAQDALGVAIKVVSFTI